MTFVILFFFLLSLYLKRNLHFFQVPAGAKEERAGEDEVQMFKID